MMLGLNILPLLFGILMYQETSGQDILGCGGFIKSASPIDLTKIKVQLLTAADSIKYSTEAAPNGYFMIPIYGKEKYRLKLLAEPGWNFEPSGPIDLDLGVCERNEDINFVFTGLDIKGKVVSSGSSEGPNGVAVSLMHNGKELQSATTQDGQYVFRNILPGKYHLSASHHAFQVTESEMDVTVDETTTVLKTPLVIHGYSITGQIVSDEEPVEGVSFILHSKSDKEVDVKGCVQGAPALYKASAVLCHVKSDSAGTFVFKSIPVGDYVIVPFYRGEKTAFDVSPSSLSVTVSHRPLLCPTQFTVSGFSVTGVVRNKPKGDGIEGAEIALNGMRVATTNAQGEYVLEGMTTGSYTIGVTAPSMSFSELVVHITPGQPLLPEITPSQFELCGTVVLESMDPAGLTVTITSKTEHTQRTTTTGPQGRFCLFVKPGSYTVKPALADSGIFLAPTSKEVLVTAAPISAESVRFSQFKATVSGNVVCMQQCGHLELTLAPGEAHGKPFTQTITSSSNTVTFSFTGVIPGKYQLSAAKASWCWLDETTTLNIEDRDIANLKVTQRGFTANINVKHDIRIAYAEKLDGKDKKAKKEETTLSLTAGNNRLCLPTASEFIVKPISCHQFEKDQYTVMAGESAVVDLTIKKYQISLQLESPSSVDDCQFEIRSEQDDLLNSVKMPATKVDAGVHKSSLMHFVGAGALRVRVIPKSSLVLFNVPSMAINIVPETCPAAEVKVQADAAVFVQGQVKPNLADLPVDVMVGDEVIQSTVTNNKGEYRVGPLVTGLNYHVRIEKPGYILTPEENPFNFNAYKLAEVQVLVTSDGQPLPGVILSLSGGNFRTNNYTNPDGTFSFIGLTPGDYYLKAILKEYEFTPSSDLIQVAEGKTLKVDIKGVRVSYSCYGSIVNIRGEPVDTNVHVTGIGMDGSCKNMEESCVTEPNGQFRLRGLQPGCAYQVTLSTELRSFRVSPDRMTVSMEKQDKIIGNFTVFETLTDCDVAVFVNADSEFLPQLKVVVTKEKSPTPLYTLSMKRSKVVYLPTLPLDGQKYNVRLESSLSKLVYWSSALEYVVVTDAASKIVSFNFEPKARSATSVEGRESSITAMVLVIVTTLLVLFRHKVTALTTRA